MIVDDSVLTPEAAQKNELAAERRLSVEAQDEVQRLTQNIFFEKDRLRSRSVLFLETTRRFSSLWLVTSVASVLARALEREIHVLSLTRGGENGTTRRSPDGFILHKFARLGITGDPAISLIQGLAAFDVHETPVLVHMSHDATAVASLPRMDFVDDVVLLVRSAHTRRVDLRRMEQHLLSTGASLLGSVLLDKVDPVPSGVRSLL